MSKELLEVGKVSHYFTNIEVAVVDLEGPLKVGEKIIVRGATTEFTQTVKSMQIEHEKVEEAGPGDSIGLEVEDRVREGDKVYKILEE